ncbi:hypothetical protein WMY93_001690 [Mugilogobius chulae]|uniref:Uncharacterized protein n=1 Tax=Mugilogobius chulae TaxID=88201 RepID=A0AAW0PU29_9GOBI
MSDGRVDNALDAGCKEPRVREFDPGNKAADEDICRASSVTSVGRRDAMLQAPKQLTPEKEDSAVASEGQDLQV